MYFSNYIFHQFIHLAGLIEGKAITIIQRNQNPEIEGEKTIGIQSITQEQRFPNSTFHPHQDPFFTENLPLQHHPYISSQPRDHAFDQVVSNRVQTCQLHLAFISKRENVSSRSKFFFTVLGGEGGGEERRTTRGDLI